MSKRVLRRLQHSRLPSTDTTTAAASSTDIDARGGSRSAVDIAIGEESCVQVRAPPSAALPTAIDRHNHRRLHH